MTGPALYLVIASNRAPNIAAFKECVKPTTILYEFEYDKAPLNDILVGVHRQLSGRKARGVGFLLQSSELSLQLCGPGELVVSEETSASHVPVKSFFTHLVQAHAPTGRIDFFNACLSDKVACAVVRNLKNVVKVPVDIWTDDIGGPSQFGNLYFDMKRLDDKIGVKKHESLDGYEKVRTVGKGAFGTAVLYKQTKTDSLVVIKEINMMELTANERQMALNEVQVLSVLNHPNIVSYYRSFERDGILMIEMEYADGGTLAQMLVRLSRPLPERDIIHMFKQITAAIRHMHQHNILHRDLKTANVFLTKENAIKVGDFGISKAMTTRAQAQTVLGTPYYISPEMCEGKQYDQKSDIWALGCILYEMACLKRPFQGSSLPALVNSIMKGSYQSLPVSYSVTFRHLVSQILQREPQNRPTAGELIEVMIPRTVELLSKQDNASSTSSSTRHTKERSVLYEIAGFAAEFEINPIPLPPQIKILQVAASSTHFIVLTTELTVLTWGCGEHGELGHEDTPSWRETPTTVAPLGDHTISSVAAGNGFSLFLSDSGMLLTCGDATHGCLGHGDTKNLHKPKLIEKLLQVDVAMMACGPNHVAALSADGHLYTWGLGENGRLGLGHERTTFVPTVVEFLNDNRILLRSLHCGSDGTMVISTSGTLFACGKNNENKLGLNSRSSFFGEQIAEKSLTFRKVASIGEPVVDVTMGPTHTCVLTLSEKLITMGRKEEGQLGHSSNGPANFKAMSDYVIEYMSAGPMYTAVATLENVLLLWGTVQNSNISQSRRLNADNILYSKPTEILALYSSPTQQEAGNMIWIGGVDASPRGLFITVHTTVPLPNTAAAHSDQTNHKVHDGDTDSNGPVPEWIKADIADSEAVWGGYTSTATSFA